MQLPRITGETVARDSDWFFRRDGSRFPVSSVSVPIDMPGGRGALVVFADIGDRLRAEHVVGERDAVPGSREDSVRRIAALAAGVVGLPLVAVWRYASDGTTATVIGASSEGQHPFQPGTRWPLEGAAFLTEVLKTGRPTRIDDFSGLPGTIADAARDAGLRAGAGVPIMVGDDVWGECRATPFVPRCRTTRRIGSAGSASWSRQRSRTSRAGQVSPGLPRSRRRCGGLRRWWRVGRGRRRCSRRSRTRSVGCSRSTWRT
jgi:hypothetical protein